jgi:hypothetical protein
LISTRVKLYRHEREGVQIFSDSIMDTVMDSPLVLCERLGVEMANRTFYDAFRVSRKASVCGPVYVLGNGLGEY